MNSLEMLRLTRTGEGPEGEIIFAHCEILPPIDNLRWGVVVTCEHSCLPIGAHFGSMQEALDYAADVEFDCAKLESKGVVLWK